MITTLSVEKNYKNTSMDTKFKENLDDSDTIDPDAYYEWSISQTGINAKSSTSEISKKPEFDDQSDGNRIEKGVVVFYDKKANKGCIRKQEDVANYFFSSKDVFSSNFLVAKGEAVIFNSVAIRKSISRRDSSGSLDSPKKPAAKNVICVNKRRRVMFGNIAFINKQRGFGWINVNVLDKSKPFVFFLLKNIVSEHKAETLKAGDRVRLLIALEKAQPYAERLELINTSENHSFTNKLDWNSIALPKNPSPTQKEIFTGKIIGSSLLVDREFYILPDNGAAVVKAAEDAIWTETKSLSVGERVSFSLKWPLNPKNSASPFFARFVATERVFTGVVRFSDRSPSELKVRWTGARAETEFALSASQCPRLDLRKLRRNEAVRFGLRLGNGAVEVDAKTLVRAEDWEKSLQRAQKLEQKEWCSALPKPGLDLTDNKHKNISAETTQKGKEIQTPKPPPPISHFPLTALNAAIYIPKNTKNLYNNGGNYNNNPEALFTPNQNILNCNGGLYNTNPAAPSYQSSYSQNRQSAIAQATPPKMRRFEGKCVFYQIEGVCSRGLVSSLSIANQPENKCQYDNFSVAHADVWSINSVLFSGEAVKFVVLGDTKTALFVQPLNPKRAAVSGRCVFFDRERGQAGVKAADSPWPPLTFNVPEVLANKLAVGKKLLFNFGVSEDCQPFVEKVRVLDE